eukprot:157173_1
MTKIEKSKKDIYAISQFFWPTADNINYLNNNITIYPSRLFVAVYVSFIGIIAVFLINIRLYLFFQQKLKTLKTNIDIYEDINGPLIYLSKQLYEFGISFNFAFCI